MGIVLYKMMTKKFPYVEKDLEKLLEEIESKNIDFDIVKDERAKFLLKLML